MFFNTKKLLLLILLPLIIFIIIFVVYKNLPKPPPSPTPMFVSPLSSSAVRLLPQNDEEVINKNNFPSGFQGNPVKKEVVGFLPFWLLNKEEQIPYKNLTQIAYFGLEVKDDGSFVRLLEDQTYEPGFSNMKGEIFKKVKENAKKNNVKLLLTLRLMQTGPIDRLLISNTAQENLINNTINILKEEGFDGVNIDFEYEGSPDTQVIKNFTKFTKTLTEKVHQKINGGTVSVSAYSDSAYKVRITEIWPLSQVADHIIIMGYDFYRPSSETAGPVSPLTGAGKIYEYDISQTIKDYLRLSSPDKIILGVPFYGYDWPISSTNKYGRSIDFAALSSYQRTKKLIAEKKLKENWDEISNTPFLNYIDEEGIYRQVFYDNEKSLSLKLDLINVKNLAGIAIWAIGYEGENKELWNVIGKKLGPPISVTKNN